MVFESAVVDLAGDEFALDVVVLGVASFAVV